MPGRASGEVMLALSHQEGEEITEVGDCRLGVGVCQEGEGRGRRFVVGVRKSKVKLVLR
ncbi:hypothetical protein M388_02025 [Mesotoga sp. Brook.08.YT.4.2.5.4.]|nr:hypothetical protein M388_02025 [Mesotoga sp. Brook.08.YT.4.2.5.4.]